MLDHRGRCPGAPTSSLSHIQLGYVTRRLISRRAKVIFLAWDRARWRCYTPRMLPTQVDEAESKLLLEMIRPGGSDAPWRMLVTEGWRR